MIRMSLYNNKTNLGSSTQNPLLQNCGDFSSFLSRADMEATCSNVHGGSRNSSDLRYLQTDIATINPVHALLYHPVLILSLFPSHHLYFSIISHEFHVTEPQNF